MNLSQDNFSKTKLTKEFQEFGGEKSRRNVDRYTYETKTDIYDIELFNPVPTSFGSISCLIRMNGKAINIQPIHKKIIKYFNLNI